MISIENVTVSGIAATVPSEFINNSSLSHLYGEEDTKKLIKSVGVQQRHIAPPHMKTSDYCLDAAKRLISELDWEQESIGAIIFVSQTSDYKLPSTACILQNKLGLKQSTLAFDINLGCSGYVYGLNVASSLINSGVERVLLLVGDTISKLVKPGDRSTEFLFGDAGTATAIEKKVGEIIHFELGSDGSGYEHIIVDNKVDDTKSYLKMDGGEVFKFTLESVPKLISNILSKIGITPSDINACIYHQANKFMLKHLSKKSGFTQDQIPLSIEKYGNTSCASIPITICANANSNKDSVLLVGFGVGLSWGAVFLDLSETKILSVKEI